MSILGDREEDSGSKGKSKRAGKKMTRRKVKNGEKSPWEQCFAGTVPKGLGRSGFWSKPENFNLCFFANQRAADLGVVLCVFTRNEHKVQLFAMFISAVRRGFIYEVKRFNIRTKCKDICDYLTGKYAGPFAGITTVAYLKVCENIHRLTYVFWMQGDISLIFWKAFRQGGPESESSCFIFFLISFESRTCLIETLVILIIYLSHGPGTTCSYVERSAARHVPTRLSSRAKT